MESKKKENENQFFKKYMSNEEIKKIKKT